MTTESSVNKLPYESITFLRLITFTSKSKIWLAKCDFIPHDHVVVKEISLEYLAASPHRVEHVWRERAVLDHLTRENFSKSPKLYGTTKTEKSLFFVMELVLGAPLHLHLPISVETARKVFLQILDIVEFLHSHSIVHKDIKLANFILREDSGEIAVCDFGLSAIISDLSPVDCSCGTTHTKAPEPLVSFALDFFSLGILLYELLAGWKTSDSFSLDLDSLKNLPEAVDLISQLTSLDVSTRRSNFSVIRKHPFLQSSSTSSPIIPDSCLAYQFIFGRTKSPLDDF